MSESNGPLHQLGAAFYRLLFEVAEEDLGPIDESVEDGQDGDEKAIFLHRPQWEGTRAEQIEQATEFFDAWVESLPLHRAWLTSELRRLRGPSVPAEIAGMDEVATWVHERAGRPEVGTPNRVIQAHLVPGEGFGGSPYWQAMMSGLTAVVADVMTTWHPELALRLKLEPGHVYDLRPAFTFSYITPPWRLVLASANRFQDDGESRLERLLQATRRPFPEPDEPIVPEPASQVQDHAAV
ncbi:hypothetical protein [Cellulomonas sp. URHB0016]